MAPKSREHPQKQPLAYQPAQRRHATHNLPEVLAFRHKTATDRNKIRVQLPPHSTGPRATAVRPQAVAQAWGPPLLDQGRGRGRKKQPLPRRGRGARGKRQNARAVSQDSCAGACIHHGVHVGAYNPLTTKSIDSTCKSSKTSVPGLNTHPHTHTHTHAYNNHTHMPTHMQTNIHTYI